MTDADRSTDANRSSGTDPADPRLEADHTRTGHRPAHDEAVSTSAVAAPGVKEQRRDLVAREQQRFGGMRFFLAFFGWLTATGMVVLLSAVVTGVGALLGLGAQAGSSRSAALTTGITGAIVLGVVLLVAYYCGGYVAARMARFNGVKQGVAVWLWAVVIVVLATIAGLIVGSSTTVFAQLGGIPSLPVTGAAATATGIAAVVGALVVSLIGAILGGLAGMRFHRRVDRFAFEQQNEAARA